MSRARDEVDEPKFLWIHPVNGGYGILISVSSKVRSDGRILIEITISDRKIYSAPLVRGTVVVVLHWMIIDDLISPVPVHASSSRSVLVVNWWCGGHRYRNAGTLPVPAAGTVREALRHYYVRALRFVRYICGSAVVRLDLLRDSGVEVHVDIDIHSCNSSHRALYILKRRTRKSRSRCASSNRFRWNEILIEALA
jgi:hypothetical protein